MPKPSNLHRSPLAWITRLFAWLGSHELSTLVSVAFIVAGIWGFVELADEVVDQDTASFDQRVLLAMRDADDPTDPVGPGWLEEMMRDFTALGGVAVVSLLTVAVAGFLALERKHGASVLVLAAVTGGLLLSSLLKWFFSRPRPDLVPHGSIVYSSSFPSGHSMLAAVAYLTLGALLARVQPRHSLKAFLLLFSVLITVMVGTSRVYLGVHWPTDVLAGWTVGASWAIFCSLVARALQKSGHVEQDDAEANIASSNAKRTGRE